MMGMLYIFPFSTAAVGHMWSLKTWNVADATKKWNFFEKTYEII